MTKLDQDEYIEVIKKVPLHERQAWVQYDSECFKCGSEFECDCILKRHFKRNHPELVLKQWNIICPFCLWRFESKCSLLKHIFMEHEEKKHLAEEALRERGHHDNFFNFHTVENFCVNCD